MKITSPVATELKTARAALKGARELVATLNEKAKTEREATQAVTVKAKAEKLDARQKRMAGRVAKLKIDLAKAELMGSGLRATKAAMRAPSAVKVIRPVA